MLNPFEVIFGLDYLAAKPQSPADRLNRESEMCDIFIADLTGARHNVMIEVGYALKYVGTGRMLFYFQAGEHCKAVPFDVSHLNYVPIVDSGDIGATVKERIQTILTQAKNGEI